MHVWNIFNVANILYLKHLSRWMKKLHLTVAFSDWKRKVPARVYETVFADLEKTENSIELSFSCLINIEPNTPNIAPETKISFYPITVNAAIDKMRLLS
jgi:hypothetical protein